LEHALRPILFIDEPSAGDDTLSAEAICRAKVTVRQKKSTKKLTA
jgi:hypothetical protein